MNKAMTKVYCVAAWDDYYPAPDNLLACFSIKEKALEHLEQLTSKGVSFDRYEIFTYEVED